MYQVVRNSAEGARCMVFLNTLIRLVSSCNKPHASLELPTSINVLLQTVSILLNDVTSLLDKSLVFNRGLECLFLSESYALCDVLIWNQKV
jgi:hypothetical protein